MDPKYVRGSVTTASALDGLRYPLIRLGDVAESIQYGLSIRADSDASGIAIVRMVNLHDDDWDLSDLKYVPAEAADLKRMQLRRGDVLFNRTNSEELIGKCAVFDDPREFVFASYLIRVRLDTRRMLPKFLALFLATDIGRMQIDTVSRRIIGMANISASELRDLLIPMPPVSEQLAMVTDANNAREERSRLMLEADALVQALPPLR
ncbi:MAG TPA: restriction endonuclease subunit S [Coriobacteriia bacterium]